MCVDHSHSVTSVYAILANNRRQHLRRLQSLSRSGRVSRRSSVKSMSIIHIHIRRMEECTRFSRGITCRSLRLNKEQQTRRAARHSPPRGPSPGRRSPACSLAPWSAPHPPAPVAGHAVSLIFHTPFDFEPSPDVSSVRSDVISSITILSLLQGFARSRQQRA